ncbi:MAG: Uma2 family endonuclease [Firmicutes bacterium]|nr:Uma2 family endonuclease [Bacillota bacterium]
MLKPTTNRRQSYTYRDYVTWDGPERWELIAGIPYLMASPTPEHQRILGELFVLVHQALAGTACTPYMAPLDLTFDTDDRTDTVVQPDLFVMCGTWDREKRIVGVPSLVIEIISPTTATNDTIRKLNLYQRVGVPEYWIVEPDVQILNVYLHDGALLRWTADYHPGDQVRSTTFPNLLIPMDALFPS